MEKSINKSQLHICNYLWFLWNVKKLTGSQISDCISEMQLWLNSNCIDDNGHTFQWDNNCAIVPLSFNVDFNGIGIYGIDEGQISIPSCIGFIYKEDLMAFKLRWAIQDTIHYD